MSRRQALVLLPLLIAASSASSQSQQTMPLPLGGIAAANTFDAAARHGIVTKLAEALRHRYVIPEVGEKAALRISSALEGGEYDGLNRDAFVQRLSADVQVIASDKHLNIVSIGGPPSPGGRAAIPLNEAGITRADKLGGGIGYIEVVAFPPPEAFKPVLDRAMSALKGSRALILDVRRNGGGSPEAVAYLVSYLVEQGRPINSILSRVPNTREFTRESYNAVPTPVSFTRIPVYVLASKETFSGGEELAYDVQSLKRGTIVGEVTGGGANPTGPVPLGNGVLALIPFARAENPVTKTNWEGRGVQPDVPAPAIDALRVALLKLGHKPISGVEEASLARVFAPRTTPLPGTERAAGPLIAGIINGNPDYSGMTFDFAELTRSQLTRLREGLVPLGEVRSIKFRGPSMMGGDEFEVAFANGTRRISVALDPTGKVSGAMIAPN